jgi:hypothetical protein
MWAGMTAVVAEAALGEAAVAAEVRLQAAAAAVAETAAAAAAAARRR